MDQAHFETVRDGAQTLPADRLMFFHGLKPSPALELRAYDIDRFGESERYVGASSMPLSPGATAIVRARLDLETLTLSLVKTFPRIVRGYELTDAVKVMVPMDEVSSARINGQPIGRSILVLKGNFDGLVYEREGRLWAVLYFHPLPSEPWAQLDDGFHLLNPPSDLLDSLRALASNSLQAAAHDPDFTNEPSALSAVERSLLTAMEDVLRGSVGTAPASSVSEGYRRIVCKIEELIRQDLTIWHKTPELAAHAGISVRTLQSATQAICGMSPHRYSRLLRLWSVRQQLRGGSPGRCSVKACAIAHGFWHLGEFAASYKAAFGELPSETLHRAMQETI